MFFVDILHPQIHISGQNGCQRCSETKNFIEIASSFHKKVFQVKRSIFCKIQNGRPRKFFCFSLIMIVLGPPNNFGWYFGTLRSISPGQNGHQRCSETKISSKLPRHFTKRCFRSKGAFFVKSKMAALGIFFLFFTHNDSSWSPKQYWLIFWYPQINISWSKWPPKVAWKP